ncbi:MAG: hypothetical protein J5725_10485 [Bacteroidales bacterium]|nr:hypothetical protein [Bacteroidales bacterium]
MVSIDTVSHFLETNFKDMELPPDQIEIIIRTILSVVKIEYFVNPEDTLKLRYSIGTPLDPETNFNDWKEEFCGTLEELSDAQKAEKYQVYEIWYDDGDDDEELCALEIMIYKA